MLYLYSYFFNLDRITISVQPHILFIVDFYLQIPAISRCKFKHFHTDDL